MKLHTFIVYLVLSLLLFCLAGCAAPAASQPVPADSTNAVREPAVTVEEKTTGALIVADDFANLPPVSPSQPVYDRYTLADRRQQQLPLELPKLAPYSEQKIVYLTFDDGPDDKNTPAVLDLLAEADVKATFFVLGQKAQLYPAVLQRIYAAGHAIGNHSYDHDYKKLYASPASYLAEMEKTDAILQSALGVRPLISRAPGGTAGHFTPAFSAALQANGYKEYGWNISTADAAPNHPLAQDFIDNVLSQLETHPSLADHAIVLMHSSTSHEETVKALPTIIRIFKDRGYTFGVISPMTPSAW